MKIDTSVLSEYEIEEINNLLLNCPNDPPQLEDMWQIMDDVWDSLGCDNRDPQPECIQEFYKHPVWILNGFFIEQHSLSMQHRNAVADWVIQNAVDRILDYGGGFGTQARLIAERDSSIRVDIYEPYPSRAAIHMMKPYSNIRFIRSPSQGYKCIIAMDVLEHVTDPLKVLADIIETVQMGGYLIIANHFYPSIKCHLPSTFHLRYTFDLFAQLMGLRVVSSCQGSHACIYQRERKSVRNWRTLRVLESVSNLVFPFLKVGHAAYTRARRFLR